MNQQPRPLRELCQALTVVELVKAGLPQWGGHEASSVKLLGPEDRGIRVRRPWAVDYVPLTARMEHSTAGFSRGTLSIGGPFAGHVWVDETPVKIPPYRHWLLRCQGCNRQCRVLLWAPGRSSWACRRCHHVRYPDKQRLNSMPPRPNAPDELDVLERDIRRLKLLRRATSQATARFEALKRRDGI